MKSWFTSLNGAITLSVIALLTELWRAFLDFQHEYSNFLNSTGMDEIPSFGKWLRQRRRTLDPG